MAQIVPGYEILLEIFPDVPEIQINEMIQLVEEATPNDTHEAKIDRIYDLLSGFNAVAAVEEHVAPDGREGQVAPDPVINNDLLYQELSGLYPDASEQCVLNYCQNLPPNTTHEHALLNFIQNGYERRDIDPIDILEQLELALPDADPSYLRTESNRLALLPQQDIDDFVQNALDNGGYPTRESYLKNKKETDTAAMYKNRFSVQKFLEVFPDPEKTFTDPDRNLSLNDESSENDIKYAQTFLQNQYPFVRKKCIDVLFPKNKNLVEVCERLDRLGKTMRLPRDQVWSEDTSNIELLQEVAFLKHRKFLKRAVKEKDENYRTAKEEARKLNLLQTCQCCYDDELIPEECFFCCKDCSFCKECVRRGAENVIGSGELRIPCFATCDSEFSLQTLQMVLSPKIFQRLSQKITSEEVKKANVDGLETCPFCDFAMVLPDTERIFKCINEDCRVESCRECRHKSHIPLRCSEIEYDEDVRRRTFIENKMTEALTRTCYRCNKTFIKTNGCNKMTCSCGAKMCYLCRQPVEDYSHFGAGSKCALHTNDAEVNLNDILQNVQQAKNELGDVQIKFDPSKDIRQFYSTSS